MSLVGVYHGFRMSGVCSSFGGEMTAGVGLNAFFGQNAHYPSGKGASSLFVKRFMGLPITSHEQILGGKTLDPLT